MLSSGSAIEKAAPPLCTDQTDSSEACGSRTAIPMQGGDMHLVLSLMHCLNVSRTRITAHQGQHKNGRKYFPTIFSRFWLVTFCKKPQTKVWWLSASKIPQRLKVLAIPL